jgi:uncharacterized protein YodC (DUF2158 family)
MSEFKVGDCALLKNGDSPKMTVNEVSNSLTDENTFDVQCTWFVKDVPQYRTYKSTVLKHCPKESTNEQVLKASQKIFPPTNR